MASSGQIRHFCCLQQKKSEMWSQIAVLFHGKLSILAGRGCLPLRKGLIPFSDLQKTPYLPLGLWESRTLFIGKEKWIKVHESGFKRWQWWLHKLDNLVFMKPELCSPHQPEHLLFTFLLWEGGWQKPPCKETHQVPQVGPDEDGRRLGEDVASCHRNLPHHVIC